MKPTRMLQRGGKWCYAGGGYGNDNRADRRLDRRARAREALAEIREQSKDLHNPKTDCPACGENTLAGGAHDHDDC